MRAPRRIVTVLVALVAVALSLSGCFRRQFPERRQFVVAVERTDPSRAASGDVLKIARVRSEAQYDRKSFVYRTGELTYSDDFYNVFYVSPSRMVGSSMQQWLASSGLFETVADIDSLIRAGWLLESRLEAFYIDQRDANDPRAVIELAVSLVNGATSPPTLAFERRYQEMVAVRGGASDDYVLAWSDALSRVLTRVEADLAVVVSPRKAR